MGNEGRRIASVLAAFAVSTVMWAGNARAADNVITAIVQTSPGTTGDTIARELSEQFVKKFDTTLVVTNKPGASGNIAIEYVAHAKPDGKTLLVASTSFAGNAALNKLPYDPIKDFEPVALLGTGTLVLAVPSSFPARTLAEFVAAAKAKPGSINYASAGVGTTAHLSMELFKLVAGVNLFHVPYKDSSSAITDLAGGRVSAMILPLSTAENMIEAGRLRVLAVLGQQRDPGLPGTPTMSELGYGRVQAATWYALLAPRGTPADTVKRLNREVNDALKEPGVVKKLTSAGVTLTDAPPALMATMIKDEVNRWPPVVQAAHITTN